MAASIRTSRPAATDEREEEARDIRRGQWLPARAETRESYPRPVAASTHPGAPLRPEARRSSGCFPIGRPNYLTDVAGIVDAPSAAEINNLAARLRTATGAELAVVTLPTIEDRAPVDVALTIGRAWGSRWQGRDRRLGP